MADNRKKPAAKRGATKPNGAMFAWLAIGLVVAVVATIVLIKITGSTTPATSNGKQGPTSAAIYNAVTGIPASVYDQVGVTSPTIQVFPPTVKTGQPPLTYTVNGKKLAGAFYWGAEYCPYCAATRWGIIAAFARFGTWTTGLNNMVSASNDYAPNTQTFSFYKTAYSSQYVAFKAFEVVGPINNGTTLMKTPAKEQALVQKYNPQSSFPFLNVGNMSFQLGTAFDPAALAGLSRTEIASNLTDPNNPITQAIVASANYITAGICAANKSAPASVCTSSGVMAAATALHLTL